MRAGYELSNEDQPIKSSVPERETGIEPATFSFGNHIPG